MTDERRKDNQHIIGLMTEIRDSLECFSANDDAMNKLQAVLTILNGNGHPENGLVFRVTETHRYVRELAKWQEAHDDHHKEERKSSSDKTWDVVRGIIIWVLPIVLYGVAYVAVIKP
jgi:hypothetical protein